MPCSPLTINTQGMHPSDDVAQEDQNHLPVRVKICICMFCLCRPLADSEKLPVRSHRAAGAPKSPAEDGEAENATPQEPKKKSSKEKRDKKKDKERDRKVSLRCWKHFPPSGHKSDSRSTQSEGRTVVRCQLRRHNLMTQCLHFLTWLTPTGIYSPVFTEEQRREEEEKTQTWRKGGGSSWRSRRRARGPIGRNEGGGSTAHFN